MQKVMLKCINIYTVNECDEGHMRTTVSIDDELYAKVLEVADPGLDKAELFREAMQVFLRVQIGKRLAALGGRSPSMRDIPRRKG